MADAEERVQILEERVKNLELFVIGILKAFQADGRVNPAWLSEVRGCLGASKGPADGAEN